MFASLAELRQLSETERNCQLDKIIRAVINDRNSAAASIVREAIVAKELAIVRYLFGEYRVAADAFTDGKSRFIRVAVETGDNEIILCLLENAHNEDVLSWAMETAVQMSKADIVALLISQGADATGVIVHYSGNETFLAKAAENNDIATMEILLEHGAKVDVSIELAESYYSKYELLKDRYYHTIKNLLSFAVGTDLSKSFFPKDISGMNFCGVSIKGKPVTIEMLLAEKKTGVKQAIFTLDDVHQLSDADMKARVLTQLEKQFKLRGQQISRTGVVNLVPLWRAAKMGDEETVKIRLQAGCNPNEEKKGDDSKSPLAYAVAEGHEKIVALLIQHPKIDKTKFPELQKLAKANNHEGINKLFERMRDVNLLDEHGNASLHYAVKKGDVEAVCNLIARGANVNLKGKEGYPLFYAIEETKNHTRSWKPSEKKLQIIALLLQQHADPNLKTKFYNAVDQAAAAGNFPVLQLLIPHATKESRNGQPWYSNIILYSCESREWIKILESVKTENKGINLNFTDWNGNETPLSDVLKEMWGTTKCREEFVRNSYYHFDYLLNNGADPSFAYAGTTALHEFISCADLFKNDPNISAIQGAYAKIIDPCIAHGFKIDTPNQQGQTLLQLAACNDNWFAVRLLLSRGADPTINDDQVNTPSEYATTASCTIMNSRDFNNWLDGEKNKYVAFNKKIAASFNSEVVVPVTASSSTALMLEQLNPEGNYTPETKCYIEHMRAKTSNTKIAASLHLSQEEIEKLQFYYDDISKRLMDIPVLLNDHVYDLETLIQLLNENMPDPFTGGSFSLADIMLASQTAAGIELELEELKKLRSQTQVQQDDDNYGVHGLFVYQGKNQGGIAF